MLERHEADVSVLFADITGYTHLSAAMEPERLNQLVELYFAAFLDEILRLGGDVNETSGDGLMVIQDPEGVAGTRWTYTASGTTTNIAARLAALAEDGSIVLSEETRRRLGDEFELVDLGPQSLKNVAAPVRAYRCSLPLETRTSAGETKP